MSTDEENINTASIEEMINANLGIDATELDESSSEDPAEVDDLLATDTSEEVSELIPEETPDNEAEIIAEESTDILEQAETINEEIEEPLNPKQVADLVTENEEQASNSEPDNNDIDLSVPDDEANANQSIEETESDTASDTEESTQADSVPVEAEENLVESNIEVDIQNENEVLNEEITETTEADQIEDVSAGSSSDSEPMLALETEVAELENEIQDQLDQFIEQADHLKSNIKSELQRVSSDNEQLQEQVTNLAQQLSDAEGKIQSFTEVQDKQQATIHKLILIIKGIRTKISHLYDEE